MKTAGVVLILRRTLDVQPLVLVVTNRAFGGLSLPGGKVKDGEDPRRAAIREVHEETGIILLGHDLSHVARSVNVISVDGVPEECDVTVFHARHMFGDARDVEEGTTHSWVTWFELLDRSPFRPFYAKHFPDGVLHLRGTHREAMPIQRP